MPDSLTRQTPAQHPGPGRERRTRGPGDRSRARVLEHAAALATIEGLDGVSIARLAAATGMPKSSVYALFGSKEELQLATNLLLRRRPRDLIPLP